MDISMMLPLLMGMVGTKKEDNNDENKEQSNNSNQMANMAKMLSALKGGGMPNLADVLPADDKTKSILEMAKLLSQKNQSQPRPPDVEIKKQEQTTPKNLHKPFDAIKGFATNEVDAALSKLFKNKD